MDNNQYVKLLNNIINFGIDEKEELTIEERKQRIENFRNSLSYEQYEELFLKIEDYLFNIKEGLQSKEAVLNKLLEIINSCTVFENNISKFPISIQKIYMSYMQFRRLLILFDMIYSCEFTRVFDFEELMMSYINYLDSFENELFIHLNFSRIKKFNNNILEYLNKKDFNGIKHIENINNKELINTIKNRIASFQNNR